jgi:isoleucyl-tRNA synthetase
VRQHGIVLGSDGQKMSKSLRNYPDVSEVFDRDGADAMRWFLMSSHPARRQPRRHRGGHPRGGAPGAHPAVERWYFFSLYANAANGGAGYTATWSTASTDPLDRYLLAKLRELVETCRARWTPTTSRVPASRCASSSTS